MLLNYAQSYFRRWGGKDVEDFKSLPNPPNPEVEILASLHLKADGITKMTKEKAHNYQVHKCYYKGNQCLHNILGICNAHIQTPPLFYFTC